MRLRYGLLLLLGTLIPILSIGIIFAQEPEISSDDYVYITCGVKDPTTELIKAAALDTAKRFGISLKILSPSKPLDVHETMKLLEKAIAAKPRGIAITLFHPTAFDVLVRQAVMEGILVISFFADDWTDNPRQAYVGYDWVMETERLGVALARELLPRSKVLVFAHSGPDARTTLKLKGLLNVFKHYNLLYEVLRANFGAEEGVLEEYWKGYGDEFDAIIGLDYETSVAIAKLAAKEDLDGVLLGGCIPTSVPLEGVDLNVFDALLRVVPELQGAVPLEDLHYSYIYSVVPSDILLHAKLVLKEE